MKNVFLCIFYRFILSLAYSNECPLTVSKKKFDSDERTAPMVNATGFSQSPEGIQVHDIIP